MEILMLVLFYYLSQNPDFAKSVQPLMSQIKDSQQMLSFLNDLSKFSETFSTFKEEKKTEKEENKKSEPKKDEKDPQSPTTGIADEFIQNILDSYLKKR
ncbi:MAG: hypothetical protein IJZ32_03025 [Clostridia bacterium]|nr:hypothetical protein [Clostridia bacterium]